MTWVVARSSRSPTATTSPSRTRAASRRPSRIRAAIGAASPPGRAPARRPRRGDALLELRAPRGGLGRAVVRERVARRAGRRGVVARRAGALLRGLALGLAELLRVRRRGRGGRGRGGGRAAPRVLGALEGLLPGRGGLGVALLRRARGLGVGVGAARGLELGLGGADGLGLARGRGLGLEDVGRLGLGGGPGPLDARGLGPLRGLGLARARLRGRDDRARGARRPTQEEKRRDTALASLRAIATKDTAPLLARIAAKFAGAVLLVVERVVHLLVAAGGGGPARAARVALDGDALHRLEGRVAEHVPTTIASSGWRWCMADARAREDALS